MFFVGLCRFWIGGVGCYVVGVLVFGWLLLCFRCCVVGLV